MLAVTNVTVNEAIKISSVSWYLMLVRLVKRIQDYSGLLTGKLLSVDHSSQAPS
jgi:hypothetical protein